MDSFEAGSRKLWKQLPIRGWLEWSNILPSALLVILFSMPSFGEEIRYCVEQNATGYNPDKNRKEEYTRTGFIEYRFTMKFINKTEIILSHSDGRIEKYNCSVPYSFRENSLMCSEKFYHLTFNIDSGDFVYAQMYGFSGVKGDSVRVSIGNCTKF